MPKTEFLFCPGCNSYSLIKNRADGQGKDAVVIKKRENGELQEIKTSRKSGIIFREINGEFCLGCGSEKIEQRPNHEIGETIGSFLKGRI